MWKGMENCARKWCLFLCTILYEVTFGRFARCVGVKPKINPDYDLWPLDHLKGSKCSATLYCISECYVTPKSRKIRASMWAIPDRRYSGTRVCWQCLKKLCRVSGVLERRAALWRYYEVGFWAHRHATHIGWKNKNAIRNNDLKSTINSLYSSG